MDQTDFQEIEKELKQRYLRDMILDCGYDVDDFCKFMTKKRYNGTDVDNWTFEEIVEVIDIFLKRFDDGLSKNFYPSD